MIGLDPEELEGMLEEYGVSGSGSGNTYGGSVVTFPSLPAMAGISDIGQPNIMGSHLFAKTCTGSTVQRTESCVLRVDFCTDMGAAFVPAVPRFTQADADATMAGYNEFQQQQLAAVIVNSSATSHAH